MLTPAEEQMLEDWLIEMAKIGYGRSRQQLQLAVKKILETEKRENPFKDNMPGHKWVCSKFTMDRTNHASLG